MSEALYLDTARLGLMSPSAQRLQNSFARLAGDPHGLLYFSDFLAQGLEGCPSYWRSRFPDLDAWGGLAGLNQSVRRLTQAPHRSEVLFASRSATLMELAARRLAVVCSRVLTVDLLWAPYRRILSHACRQTDTETVVCPLRAASLLGEESSLQLATRVCEAVEKYACDGLVLPLMDHRGVTLPVDTIMDRLGSGGHRLKYVAADASQALGQVPIDLKSLGCNFLVGGAHKWIGGYHPLGLGVSVGPALPKSTTLVRSDPLHRLTQEAAGVVTPRHGETAAILPLLTAAGAIADLTIESIEQRLIVRQANRRRLRTLLEESGWLPVRQIPENHGILIARPPATSRQDSQPDRRSFAQHGIAVTSYNNRMVRFSLPSAPFSDRDASLLQAALSGGVAPPIAKPPLSPFTTKGNFSCPTVELTTARPAGSTKRTKAKSLATTLTETSVA